MFEHFAKCKIFFWEKSQEENGEKKKKNPTKPEN